MPCACTETTTVDQIAHLLDGVLAIEVCQLEILVQQAHECDGKEMDAPDEPFVVTRQALRMFWHFRCYLESVEVTSTHG